MGRKVFISVLGTGFYSQCQYINSDFQSIETRFIQQASLGYAQAECWKSTDIGYVLLTEGAKKLNWSTDLKERENPRSKQMETYVGLQEALRKMNLPIKIEGVDIPEGKTEEEMWNIFTIIFNLLEENDELYIDLTHSFRYLPMLLLTLVNYAQFLKQITVCQVSYGNYEARDQVTNQAPIIDLLPLHALQEWTFAAANFLQNGYIKQLNDLCSRALKPLTNSQEKKEKNPSANALGQYMKALSTAIEDMKSCRGVNILNGANISEVIRWEKEITDSTLPVMAPIIEKIKNTFCFVASESIMNGYRSAKWCFDNQLYQQSVTILQENIISHICEAMDWDKIEESKRNLISQALNIYSLKRTEEKWEINTENKLLVEQLFELNLFPQLSSIYIGTTGLRNDFNHAGIRVNPMATKSIPNAIGKSIDKIYKLFEL